MKWNAERGEEEVDQSESSMLITLWLGAAGTFFVATFLLTLLSDVGSFSLSVSTSMASGWGA